ncbi:MAG: thioredoxin family protein [Flavobacterium sp.]|nr:thioredoxin family protein [Flavobacterium sp.]
MKMAIAEALLHSHTYTEYRSIVSDLLSQGKSTGTEQSEEILHYSKLNEVRMNRLDRTIVIAEDVIRDLLSLNKQYLWLVISEGWCGDAAQLLPIMNKMAAIAPGVQMKVVFRDQNPVLMDGFLTNGARSIPKLILIDSHTMNVLGSWGPRPNGASELIKSYKLQYGVVDETAKTELQLWYLHDKGLSTQREILQMMLDSETFYLKRNI